jgi:hypothetical protein
MQGQYQPSAGFDQTPPAPQMSVLQPTPSPSLPDYSASAGEPTAAPDLHSQYQSLRPVLGDQNAMLATVNPEIGKTLIAQALANQQSGDSANVVPAGYRLGGIPIPPMGPPPPPPRIPVPAIPDSWKAAWILLQLYPSIVSGLARGGGDDGDNRKEEIRELAFPNWNELSKQQMASRKGGGRSDAEDDPDPDVWVERYWKQVAARARERGKAVSRTTVGVEGDPGDFCSDRHEEEQKRCSARIPEYAHGNFLQGCMTRAAERWAKCVANGGQPDPTELPEWDLDPDEELFRNLDR